MIAFINILYLVIMLFFLVAAFFIAYHIIKYSLSRTEMIISLSIFLSIFLVLIFSNLYLFFSIRMDQIITSLIN